MWLASAGLALGVFSWLPIAPNTAGLFLLLLAVPVLILLNKDWDRDKVQAAKNPAPEPTTS
jgi:hypothetical protein